MRRLAEWWEDIGPKGRISYSLLGLVFLFTTLLYCLGITSLMIAPTDKSSVRPMNIAVDTNTPTPTLLATVTLTPKPTNTLAPTPTEPPLRPTSTPRPANTATRTATIVRTQTPPRTSTPGAIYTATKPPTTAGPTPRGSVTPTPTVKNTPTASLSHTLTATPTSRPQRVHIVVAGEGLTGIARQYNITVNELADANGLSSTSLVYTGQRLVIP